jgi:hypothetical protein
MMKRAYNDFRKLLDFVEKLEYDPSTVEYTDVANLSAPDNSYGMFIFNFNDFVIEVIVYLSQSESAYVCGVNYRELDSSRKLTICGVSDSLTILSDSFQNKVRSWIMNINRFTPYIDDITWFTKKIDVLNK